jgi:hypothetical protein
MFYLSAESQNFHNRKHLIAQSADYRQNNKEIHSSPLLCAVIAGLTRNLSVFSGEFRINKGLQPLVL